MYTEEPILSENTSNLAYLIQERIRVVQLWCAQQQIGVSHQSVDRTYDGPGWRSEELTPYGDFDFFVEEEERVHLVDSVCVHRANLLNRFPKKRRIGRGALLAYEPDINTCCGTSAAETHGFFDDDNVPPWDTWIAFIPDYDDPRGVFSGYLLSWIPEKLIALADHGMHFNAEQCIRWHGENEEDAWLINQLVSSEISESLSKTPRFTLWNDAMILHRTKSLKTPVTFDLKI